MPFVTEEIYCSIPHACASINLESLPTEIQLDTTEHEMNEVNELITMIQAVREIKADYNLKPSAPVNIYVSDQQGEYRGVDEAMAAILYKMCKATWCEGNRAEEVVSRNILNGSLSIALAEMINVEEEIEKGEKEIKRLKSEISRAEGMLNNPNFANKAPADKVQAERDKVTSFQNQLQIVEVRLNEMKAKLK